ncbi:MAG: ACT domain-containing protein [Abditibacteriota bacterium]|nr:ACT domain-containing protein [Abditibacteriota bacterium]
MYNAVSVFMENKSGKLAKVTEVLAKNNINIFMIDVDDNGQFGVLRVFTDKPKEARDILFDENFTVALEKSVIVEIEDKVGSISKLFKIVDEAGLNIKDASGCVIEQGSKAYFAMRSDSPEKLEAVLADNGIKILKGF